MRPSALYSNTIITVLSSKLLDEHQTKRMIAAPSFTDAARILLECGYDANVIANTDEDEGRIIDDEMKRCVEMFKKICPDDALLSAVLAKFDYHNARVLYKSRFDAIGIYDATYRFGAIKYEQLEKAITRKDYRFLPDNMRHALKALDSIESLSADRIDAEFNKYMLAEIQKIAGKIKSAPVQQYVMTGDEKVLKNCGDSFGLEKSLKWFILKKRELAVARTILMGKKVGMSRDKIRGLVKGAK